MIIKEFEERLLCEVGESMEVELPRKGLKLDPRVNFPPHIRFSIRYHDNGIIVTLTRVDDDDVNDLSWHEYAGFSMRLYDPQTERVPDFNSTIYVYMGLDDEHAPIDKTLIIIHPSVKIIQQCAFSDCSKLRRVIMHENVEIIERSAFIGCYSLNAFFLPSSIKEIGDYAFINCTNLRILSIPQTIDIRKIGDRIIENCHTILRITQIPSYEFDDIGYMINNDQVNQAIIDFNHNLPPLHKVCLNTNVSAQSIRQCIETHGIAAAYNTDYGDGMTPMHILALNPHADEQAILALFHANMGVVFETYSESYVDGGDESDENEQRSAIGGKTPLECLGEYDVKSYLSIIAALCRHREAHSNPTVEESMRKKRQKLN